MEKQDVPWQAWLLSGVFQWRAGNGTRYTGIDLTHVNGISKVKLGPSYATLRRARFWDLGFGIWNLEFGIWNLGPDSYRD